MVDDPISEDGFCSSISESLLDSMKLSIDKKLFYFSKFPLRFGSIKLQLAAFYYTRIQFYLRDVGDVSNVTFSPAQDSSKSDESSKALSSYKNSDIFILFDN